MADLYDRLFTADENKIPIHAFEAAITEYADGQATTRDQIIAAWGLDAAATADLDAVLAKVNAQSNATTKLVWITRFNAVNSLCEAGLRYTTKAAYRTRLGL